MLLKEYIYFSHPKLLNWNGTWRRVQLIIHYTNSAVYVLRVIAVISCMIVSQYVGYKVNI